MTAPNANLNAILLKDGWNTEEEKHDWMLRHSLIHNQISQAQTIIQQGIADIVDIVDQGTFGWVLSQNSGSTVANNDAWASIGTGVQAGGQSPSGTSLTSVPNVSMTTGVGVNGYAGFDNPGVGAVGGFYRQMSGSSFTGGFRATCVGGWDSPGHTADFDSSRMFFGVMFNIQTLATTEPSAFADGLGLSHDSSDANMNFMTNNGSSAIKFDIGVKASALAGHLLKLVIFVPPNGSYASLNLIDVVTGLSYSNTFGAGLPAVDVELAFMQQIGNVANTNNMTCYFHRRGYRSFG